MANDIATDESDNFYRVYWGDTLVQQWNPADSLTISWKYREFYKTPYIYSPNPSLKVFKSDIVYIYDNRQIVKYSISGTFISQFTLPTGSSFKTVLSEDSVFVFDSLTQSLRLYDHNWQTYSQTPLHISSSQRLWGRCEMFNDSTILTSAGDYSYGNSQWGNTYLAVYSIKTGDLIAKLIADNATMGTDFALGVDKRIYVLKDNRIVIYQGKLF
jgi:hypothetical protein